MRSDMDKTCDRYNVRAEFVYGAAHKPPQWAAHNWRVTLTRRVDGRRRSLSCDFGGGSAVTNPTAADVVSSLVLDTNCGEMDFEEFCSEFGYDSIDPDSRHVSALTAYKTWRACAAMAPKVRRFLGDEFEEFAQSSH